MNIIIILLLFVLLLSAYAVICSAVECEVSHGACIAVSGNTMATLDISPKPVKAMKELFFRVTIKGTKIKAPLLLVLSMPGMYMGRNEVLLKQVPDGSFIGSGIIPRCPTGKKLWQADIAIPGSGSVSYQFHVDD
jgi:hypothetical protein